MENIERTGENSLLIETSNLDKFFFLRHGVLKAVNNVSLKIQQGKTLGVVGESGCGKSTLGKTILRIYEPTSGEIRYSGENILKFNKAKMKTFQKKAQIIFQDPNSSLNPRMTISEIIADPLIVNRITSSKSERQDIVKELMNIVGLSERLSNAYPHELDGGRLQRVGVARALSLNPKFIVCDEPVSALDVSIQAQILNLLADLQEQRDLTYMFITHNLSVVKHISNQIMVMYLGKCVEIAPTEELFSRPLHPYTEALLDAIPVPSLEMKNKKPKLIKGELTSPISLPPGCAFAPRCEYVTQKCIGTDIDLISVGNDHMVACTLFE